MMSRLFRRISWLLFMIVASATLVLIAAAAVLLMKGGRLEAVQSNSMKPAIVRGDAVLVWPTKSLHVGDVITFNSLSAPQLTVTHRVIELYGTTVRTKGDAVQTVDVPTQANKVKGKVIAVLPGFGVVLDQLHRPLVLVGLLYIPVLAILVFEAYNLARAWKSPYRYPGYGI